MKEATLCAILLTGCVKVQLPPEQPEEQLVVVDVPGEGLEISESELQVSESEPKINYRDFSRSFFIDIFSMPNRYFIFEDHDMDVRFQTEAHNTTHNGKPLSYLYHKVNDKENNKELKKIYEMSDHGLLGRFNDVDSFRLCLPEKYLPKLSNGEYEYVCFGELITPLRRRMFYSVLEAQNTAFKAYKLLKCEGSGVKLAGEEFSCLEDK